MQIDPNVPLFSLTVAQFKQLLRSENARPEPAKEELPKYLTPVKLAELTGYKLTTIYQNNYNNLIPGAKKVGNRLLFDTSVILEWIEENSIPTKAERITAIERRSRL